MKLGYFPGCSLHSTSREIDESLRLVAPILGLSLTELDGWSCCGASSAHATDHLLGVALPARNLALAAEQGHDAIVAPCAACFNRLASAQRAMRDDPQLAAEVTAVLERPLPKTMAVRSIVDVLLELKDDIKAHAKTPRTDLKVACYYGCLLVRPAAVVGGDPENPTGMEEIVAATGATAVIWNKRLDCCGGSLSLPRAPSVVRLGREIIDDAKSHGAQAIVVACPMCHTNLDLRQRAMARGTPLGMPILHLTQLVGLALGLDASALGIRRHFVDATGITANDGSPAATVGGVP